MNPNKDASFALNQANDAQSYYENTTHHASRWRPSTLD